MATDIITFDEVLRLARHLSPADQGRLRAALQPATDEDAERAVQRQRNQAAIDLLDAWRVEAATDAEEDDWWDEFAQDIDAYRMSSRPLFPDRTQQR